MDATPASPLLAKALPVTVDADVTFAEPWEAKAFAIIVKLAQERTVILVEHKMKLVMGISDRVLVLHHGELLAQGTPADVRQNEQVKRVYLGQREH